MTRVASRGNGGTVAEPFKDWIHRGVIQALGESIVSVHPSFPLPDFVGSASSGLEPLGLTGRVGHVARALRAALPGPLPEVLPILVAALPPPLPDEQGVGAGFGWWPVLRLVEDEGPSHPEPSLAALREMTRRFSAEFAVRPLIDAHPEVAWRALEAWADDPDLHVRRLSSEGSRPRLPWGRRLPASIADPSRGLALIGRLVDDPSPYVRRSVANHLGDVAKDHPERALAAATRWLEWDPSRRDTARHGLRWLLKRGHPGALALFGHDEAEVAVTGLAVEPARVRVGDPVEVRAVITAAVDARVRVDLVWSWPGARGGWSSRTFRGGDRSVVAGEPWAFVTRLSTRPVTTRPTRPGVHQVALRVQGRTTDPVPFVLEA